ncbi:MAG TPA: hypothetical protein VKS44_06585 [Candidatus Acidoferrales bacterium]|nr:hypothetical protein [Candidatus Acidoferrales bacterium]
MGVRTPNQPQRNAITEEDRRSRGPAQTRRATQERAKMGTLPIARHSDRGHGLNTSIGTEQILGRSIVRGPLWKRFVESAETSLTLETIVCPFGRAFISKGQVGTHHRAISRNGLVLLVSHEALASMEGFCARLRLSIWHRAFLRNKPAEPWGIILHAAIVEPPRTADRAGGVLQASIGRAAELAAALSIELGGERTLNFFH